MIKVTVTNTQSPYWNLIGFVLEKDWDSDSFWVPVSIKGSEMLMARRFLAEA